MLTGIGHALTSIIEEAVTFHSIARNSKAEIRIKGGNPLTENYSVIDPEVTTYEQNGALVPIADSKGGQFLEMLLKYDVVIIAGQAKSHCVAWTIDDILRNIAAKDASLAKKIYLLEDCTSPVIVPGIVDFTQQANDAFAKYAQAGMNLVKSTTPIDQWPGIDGKKLV
jgi:nicotinamidase-related amidase